MDLRVGSQRRLNPEELMLSNCGAGGLLRVPWTARIDQSILNKIKPEYSLKGLMLKLQYLATWWEEMTHWKRSWSWERLRAGGERVTEDDIAGCYHQLNGHEFEQTPGDSEGQRSLVCCSQWGFKELDTTEQLNNNKNSNKLIIFSWKFASILVFSICVSICGSVLPPCPKSYHSTQHILSKICLLL